MLEYDADTARLVDNAYRGSDFTKRRMANFDALAPATGETILDIGCGPGFFTSELARVVGERGRVIGVDPSADMRETASRRCHEQPNVRIVEGTANALPVPDGSVDGAVAVQVLEYVVDLPGALAEARRALRPQGRLVVGDMHWDSLIWFSDEPERMARMVEAWDQHLAERRVPALLGPLLRQAGLVVERTTPLVCCDTTLRADGLAVMLLHLIEGYAVRQGLVEAAVARAWAAEQRQLADQGRFFFAVTHFVVTARKP
jgi:arsenite methyltransferase